MSWGQSTFAQRLGKELSIPVCELDSLFHVSRAGGALSEDDAQRRVRALVMSNKEWILDGKYVVHVHVRYQYLNTSQSLGTAASYLLQQSDRYTL